MFLLCSYYVLIMFSKILQRNLDSHNGMYSQTSPDMIVKKKANSEAMNTLRGFFTGSECPASIEDALICLAIIHGESLTGAIAHFREALKYEDEAAREIIALEALQQIERHFLRYGSGVTYTGWEHKRSGNPYA